MRQPFRPSNDAAKHRASAHPAPERTPDSRQQPRRPSAPRAQFTTTQQRVDPTHDPTSVCVRCSCAQRETHPSTSPRVEAVAAAAGSAPGSCSPSRPSSPPPVPPPADASVAVAADNGSTTRPSDPRAWSAMERWGGRVRQGGGEVGCPGRHDSLDRGPGVGAHRHAGRRTSRARGGCRVRRREAGQHVRITGERRSFPAPAGDASTRRARRHDRCPPRLASPPWPAHAHGAARRAPFAPRRLRRVRLAAPPRRGSRSAAPWPSRCRSTQGASVGE